VFDGELVVLDDAGRPLFNELLFGRRRPTYVAFDLLMVGGEDLRPLPLKERKAKLARVGKGADRWIALTNGIVGDGRALYRAVVDADLEGIVAKCLASRMPTTRNVRGGTRFSIAATRSVAGAPSGFASGGGATSADDDIDGQLLKCDFGCGRPILPAILVEAIRLRGGA
jgi:hypothetical protein